MQHLLHKVLQTWLNKIPENWAILEWNFRCLCHLVIFLLHFDNLIWFLYKHGTYFLKSLVTNYTNKIRTASVISSLVPDLCETFFIKFPEKSHFQFFVELTTKIAESSFFTLKSVLLYYNLWNKKPKSNIWWTLVLLAYASLAASRSLLQILLTCLNFTSNSQDLFCWHKRKNGFLWIMTAAQAAKNHGG